MRKDKRVLCRQRVKFVAGCHERPACQCGCFLCGRLGETLCRNVSYLDESYSPAFLPATLEL